mgnify:CR=1 FL=1
MRNHWNVVGRGHRHDAPRLRKPTNPVDVRLQNVGALSRDQFTKAVARVLVFSSGDQTSSGQALSFSAA